MHGINYCYFIHINYSVWSDGNAMGWRMSGGCGMCDSASAEEATQGKYQEPDSCYHGDCSVPAFLCSFSFSLVIASFDL
jgi:hypothetical protein